MEEFILQFDKGIPELERSNRWKTAVNIVFQQWLDFPKDIKRLLCAGTQLWYTLLVMDYIKYEPFSPENIEYVSDTQLKHDLMNVTRFGFEQFNDNPAFNAYFGYMISVMPYYFLDYNGDYIGWQLKGTEMIRRAFILAPNPFTHALNLKSTGSENNTEYYDTCRQIWTKISSEKWGKSEVQQYFSRILNGKTH